MGFNTLLQESFFHAFSDDFSQNLRNAAVPYYLISAYVFGVFKKVRNFRSCEKSDRETGAINCGNLKFWNFLAFSTGYDRSFMGMQKMAK